MRSRFAGPSAALPPDLPFDFARGPELVEGRKGCESVKESAKQRWLCRFDLRKGSALPQGPALPLPTEATPLLKPDLAARQKDTRGAGAGVQHEGRHGVRAVPVDLGYAWWAATYDCEPNPLLALEERVLEPGLADVRGRTVLDVGCGTGRWLIRLLRRGARWGVGIDLSTEMLRRAASKCPQGAWLARADALALPLRPRTMDLIICSFTLGHLDNLSRLADELARAARKAADVYLSGLHPEARAGGWRCAFRHGAETVEIPEFHQPLEVVTGSFATAGFQLVSLLEPHFGREEKPIFVSAGKVEQFGPATTVPAIFVSHFRRARAGTTSVP